MTDADTKKDQIAVRVTYNDSRYDDPIINIVAVNIKASNCSGPSLHFVKVSAERMPKCALRVMRPTKVSFHSYLYRIFLLGFVLTRVSGGQWTCGQRSF